MRSLTIGKLAKAAAVGVETIRYYERRGLMEQPLNQTFGYRQYPQGAIQRIRFIKNIQALGFTLKEIKTVLDWMDGREMNCIHAAGMLDLKIAETEKKIEALDRMKHLLNKLRKSVGTCGGRTEMEFISDFLSPGNCPSIAGSNDE